MTINKQKLFVIEPGKLALGSFTMTIYYSTKDIIDEENNLFNWLGIKYLKDSENGFKPSEFNLWVDCTKGMSFLVLVEHYCTFNQTSYAEVLVSDSCGNSNVIKYLKLTQLEELNDPIELAKHLTGKK